MNIIFLFWDDLRRMNESNPIKDLTVLYVDVLRSTAGRTVRIFFFGDIDLDVVYHSSVNHPSLFLYHRYCVRRTPVKSRTREPREIHSKGVDSARTEQMETIRWNPRTTGKRSVDIRDRSIRRIRIVVHFQSDRLSLFLDFWTRMFNMDACLCCFSKKHSSSAILNLHKLSWTHVYRYWTSLKLTPLYS